MYIGDGSGADGMCANVGNDDLGNRVGENGVTEGFAFCFDEWSNGSTESGIKIFYNAGPDSGGDGHGCPAMSAGTDATGTVALMDDCHVYTDVADCGGGFCGDKSPVSVFNDATWHTVTIDISPKLNWRRGDGTFSDSGAAGAIVYMRLDAGGDNEYVAYGEVLTYALPTPTYLGFTGRTGGAHNNHFVKNIRMGEVTAGGSNTLVNLVTGLPNEDCVWDDCKDAETCGDAPETPAGMSAGYGKSPHAEGGCRSCTGDDMKMNGIRRCGNTAQSTMGWGSPDKIGRAHV